MSVQDISCLYSEVQNKTGEYRNFSFLPPHGRTLAPDETYTMFGDPMTAISCNGSPRRGNRRKIQAFENALARGDLIITKSPGLIIRSPNGTSSMVTVNNGGSLASSPPCWENTAQSESEAN